jgi:hypothetical protein
LRRSFLTPNCIHFFVVLILLILICSTGGEISFIRIFRGWTISFPGVINYYCSAGYPAPAPETGLSAHFWESGSGSGGRRIISTPDRLRLRSNKKSGLNRINFTLDKMTSVPSFLMNFILKYQNSDQNSDRTQRLLDILDLPTC